MDKMLHRGKYAIVDDSTAVTNKLVSRWQRLFGLSRDFSLEDKIIYLTIAGCVILSALVFIIVTIYNIVFDVESQTWIKFWHLFVWLILVLGTVTTIWFTLGGLFDLRKMFRRLSTIIRDDTDDGTVDE